MEEIIMNKTELVLVKKTINQKGFIDAVADTLGVTKKAVTEILDTMESVIYNELSMADESTTIEIKTVRGLTLVSEYQPEYEGRNPQNGEPITIEGRNRVRAKIGSQLKQAVNK